MGQRRYIGRHRRAIASLWRRCSGPARQSTPATEWVKPRAGNNEVVRLLVEHRADVNAADNLQHTALYYAGERGFTEIVELLLAAGAEG